VGKTGTGEIIVLLNRSSNEQRRLYISYRQRQRMRDKRIRELLVATGTKVRNPHPQNPTVGLPIAYATLTRVRNMIAVTGLDQVVLCCDEWICQGSASTVWENRGAWMGWWRCTQNVSLSVVAKKEPLSTHHERSRGVSSPWPFHRPFSSWSCGIYSACNSQSESTKWVLIPLKQTCHYDSRNVNVYANKYITSTPRRNAIANVSTVVSRHSFVFET
jgi:hypothetical protein